jgi:glycosyltransferase involved in cell wall biosynthesis
LLAILTSHPIQYQAPLWQALAAASDVPFEVWFLTNHGQQASQDREFGQVFTWDLDLLAGYPSYYLPVKPGWTLGSFRGIELESSWEAQLRQRKVTVLWVEGWRFQANWLAIQAAHRLGIPVWLRGESNDLKHDPWLKSLVKRPLLGRLFRKVDRFLTIGSANRRLYKSYGIPAERFASAPYCVDNDRFAAAAQELAPQRAEIRRRWNIPENAYCVLFCGKFISKKRPLDLVTAVQSQGSDPSKPMHLLMVGSGDLAEDLQSRCRVVFPEELTREGNCSEGPSASFVGFLNQTEIPAAYAAADLLVLPSDCGETWGLVVNEALSSGLLAVVSDQCGSAEDLPGQLDPNLVFRCADPADMSRAIQNAQEAAYSREQAQALADTHHLRHTVDSIRQLYDKLRCTMMSDTQ